MDHGSHKSVNEGVAPVTYGQGDRPPRGDYGRAGADYTCAQDYAQYGDDAYKRPAPAATNAAAGPRHVNPDHFKTSTQEDYAAPSADSPPHHRAAALGLHGRHSGPGRRRPGPGRRPRERGPPIRSALGARRSAISTPDRGPRAEKSAVGPL